MKFKITLEASAIVSAEVEVEADSRDEAETKAVDDANRDAFSEIQWTVDSVEGCIDAVKVEEVKE